MFLALRKSPKDLRAFGRCSHLSLKKLQKTRELYSENGVDKDRIHMSYCVAGKVRHTVWQQYSSALCCLQGMTQPSQSAAVVTCSGPVQDWSCQPSVMDKGRTCEAHPFLLIYWLLKESGRGVSVISCVSPLGSHKAPVDSSNPMVTQMALVKSSGPENKRKRHAWERTQ